MRKFWMLATGTVLIMGMAAGCVGEAENDLGFLPLKTYTDTKQVINICVNEEFVITLDCGDLAHFDWEAIYDATMLKLVDSRYKVTEPGMSEGGGTKWFKFQALKTGKIGITFVYLGRRLLSEGETPNIVVKEIDKQVFTVNIK